MASLQEQLAALNATATPTTPVEVTVATKLRELLAKLTGVPGENITDAALLVDDLGLQSLDLIELAVRCEQAFGVKTDAEVYRAMRTVADVLHYCEQSAT
ncbi:MAG: acyl carrier protein [Corynebacterium sp.]|nr:acyl carrier protein [Corynebacterium sp.]